MPENTDQAMTATPTHTDAAPAHAGATPADSAEATPMIQLQGVAKRYPGAEHYAVQPLTLDVNRGETVVLVGPSGCGKTTTLRMINRLVEPTEGTIIIDGKDVTHVNPDELRRGIGYVIQQVGLLPHMTIGDNVAMVPRMLGWAKDKTAQRVQELLTLVGLDPAMYAKRYPKQLSGGQQQRVGVARALAADPPLMLMDEPFGAIDPIMRGTIQDEFLQLQRQLHKTVVFVTHDIDEAFKMGDRIAIFAEGSRLAQFDTPLNILTRPADDFVRSFLGEGSATRRLGILTVGDVLATLPADGAWAHADVGNPIDVPPTETVAEALERVLQGGEQVVRVEGREITVHDLIVGASREGVVDD